LGCCPRPKPMRLSARPPSPRHLVETRVLQGKISSHLVKSRHAEVPQISTSTNIRLSNHLIAASGVGTRSGQGECRPTELPAGIPKPKASSSIIPDTAWFEGGSANIQMPMLAPRDCDIKALYSRANSQVVLISSDFFPSRASASNLSLYHGLRYCTTGM
jgi:hypothetical protein